MTASTTGNTTRSGSDIQSGYFDADATINAYFKSGDNFLGKSDGTAVELTAAAASGGKNVLTPDVQVYYPNTGTIDIYALYPPSKVTSGTTSFSVEADQTKPDDYKLSDLMWASIYGQTKTEADVNLSFAHKMAKISINVTGTEGVKIKNVKLINTVREIGISNIQASSRALGALSSTKGEIIVASTSEAEGLEALSGSVLFPPQTITADFIAVETNYGTTIFSTDKPFIGGTEYKASLTITRQMIGFTTTITDWTSDNGTIAVPPGSSAGLQIGNIDPQDYTGYAIEPDFTIKYTLNSVEYTLVKDVDYELTYFNNVNQGEATIIINGLVDETKLNSGVVAQQTAAVTIGKLRAIKSFTIKAAEGNISYPNNNAKVTVEYQYNTMVDNTLETNGGDGTLTFTSSDPTVAKVSERGRVTILKVGNTTISAHMAADGNYTASDAQYELEITPRKIGAAKTAGEITISLAYESIVYTGQAYYPAVVVTDKGRTLQQETHYTLDYANNTNKGTATVTVRGAGNYSSKAMDDATATFSITQALPTISIASTDAVTLPIGFSIARVATSDLGTVTYSSSSDAIATVDKNGVVTAVAEGETTITAQVTADANENYKTVKTSYIVTVVKSNWSYSYTGKVQSWTCPITGVYRLEAFGAQGASAGGFKGGAGAHISGQLKVEKNNTLYIYVGGQGINVTSSNSTQGGWNGGGVFSGTFTGTAGTQHYFCGGGGATDFALQGTINSTDWNNSAHLNSRILVAGGGGGALLREYNSNWKFSGGGGSGGAFAGEVGIGGAFPGQGGTLTAGGSAGAADGEAGKWGEGGNYIGDSNCFSAGCGGGGWYGGGAGGSNASNETPTAANPNFSQQGAGGGGSSYIYSNEYKGYYPSNISEPDAKWLMIVTGISAGARLGNGEARITYMGADE